jgi:putative phosphoesterase
MPAEPEALPAGPPLLTVGVVADTHIPDRVRALHPELLARLRAAGVARILHAGDISSARVLDALRAAAPVTAVRGNRDLLQPGLAMIERLELGGVPVALMHGHTGWLPYLWDKWQFYRHGYKLERYRDQLVADAGHARVAVFGHTHHPVVTWYRGVLLFNPGSASFGPRRGLPPSLGLLRIYPGGQVAGEILTLRGYTIKQRNWEPV